MSSTALRTDRYELTMLDAALHAGIAEAPATFEVFSRRLPEGRKAGVFAGLGRLVEGIERFRFGAAELQWLAAGGWLSRDARDWLRSYRFSGTIDAYREGEWYAPGSPVLTVEGSFGEAVLLETLVLSVLNFDSAVASAASLLVEAAAGRPIIEMGSRRTDPDAAVAAARAAYVGGFAATSNLEAGRRYGIPTAGTAAHSFVLAFPTEADAFAAQVASMGEATTLLVDTFDVETGIRHAVEAAGRRLGGIRVDSGDLPVQARRARRLLDDLGAEATKVVVTGDLDDAGLRALADAPVDVYGVGTNVVTGLGAPTASFVYKLVALGPTGEQHAVAKRSPGKATVGGRKEAWRSGAGGATPCDLVGPIGTPAPPGSRPLVHRVVEEGACVGGRSLEEAREWHQAVRTEMRRATALGLERL